MFENILSFFKKKGKTQPDTGKSKDAAKERLHLVLMQDRANVSADFLDLMKQEIIEVIKKYIDVDENAIDVRLTNKANADGTNGAPALYANIPIVSIKEEVKNTMAKQEEKVENKEEEEKKGEQGKEENKQENMPKEENTKNEKQEGSSIHSSNQQEEKEKTEQTEKKFEK